MPEHPHPSPPQTLVSFDVAASVQRDAAHADGSRMMQFVATVADGWQQGPGTFGGVVVGTMVNALEAGCGDATRPMRSVSADILAPVQPGPCLLHVETLRVGKGVTSLDARMTQNGQVVARASAAFGAARANPRTIAPEPPAPIDADTVPPAHLPAPPAPIFTQNYVYRVLDPRPFTSGPDASAAGFISLALPPDRMTAAAVVGLLDAWWPAEYSMDDGPRLMSTVAFSAQMVTDVRQLSPQRPLRYRARVCAAREGYALEMRELWDGDRLVALNQQTFVTVR